jgi:NTP pyrophosphatase (non-canonical NTP hydrolase)
MTEARVQISDAQKLAWENKLTKGFNTTDVALEVALTSAEAGEAFAAWREGGSGLGGELADTAIFLVGIAQMTGHDLDAEVARALAAEGQGSCSQIDDAQMRAWENWRADWPDTDAFPHAFGELTVALGEAFTNWRRGREHVGHHLAAAFTAVAVLAAATRHDLATEIEGKLAVNAGRTYSRGPNGTLLKDPASR